MRHFWTKALKKYSQNPERGPGSDSNGGLLQTRKHVMAVSISLLVLGFVLVPFTNCAPEHGVAPLSSGPSLLQILSGLQSQKNALFTAKCTTCHTASATDPLIVTRDLYDTDQLIADGLIIPGQPQGSDLYIYLVDEVHSSTLNVSVTTDELDVLRDWIAAEGNVFDTIVGGSGPGGGGPAPAVTFAQVKAILDQSCTNCHSNNLGRAPDLRVTTAAQLRAVTVPAGNTTPGAAGDLVVVPNNLQASWLYQSLSRMPTGAPFGLNSAQAMTIRTWILGGAN